MAFETIDIKPGEEWFGVDCHTPNCGGVILLGPVDPKMIDQKGGVTIRLEPHALKCPKCQKKSVYQTAEVRRLVGQQIQ
jgi:predicted RNA-binding Zn-ribbon protein involved in translation (DUF1610 family)